MSQLELKARIISILSGHTREMEGYSYFSSNPGIPEDEYEEIADEVIAALALARMESNDAEELQFYREHVGNDLDNMLIDAGVFEVTHSGGYKAAWANSMDSLERLIDRKSAKAEPLTGQHASLWVQFANNGNIQFFTRDPDRAVEESFCYARPLTAYYEKPFPVEDLSIFKDLIGFAAYQAIGLPETDPRRDFIRQASDLIAIMERKQIAASEADE